jgi:uncharacterized protein
MAVSFTSHEARGPVTLLPGGGFHFGGKPHKGSILVSPGGIYDWPAASSAAGESGILRFLDEERDARCDFLLLGTGARTRLPSPALRDEIEQRGLGLEAMDTRAACRTYNVLLAENRFFCAALLEI